LDVFARFGRAALLRRIDSRSASDTVVVTVLRSSGTFPCAAACFMLRALGFHQAFHGRRKFLRSAMAVTDRTTRCALGVCFGNSDGLPHQAQKKRDGEPSRSA